MKKFILAFLLIPNLAFGVYCKPVTYLAEGQPAPCRGYLFTPEEEFLVRSQAIKYTELEKLTKTQDEMINLLDNRLDLSLRKIDGLEQQVTYIKSENTLEKIVYFCLGIAISIGLNKVIK